MKTVLRLIVGTAICAAIVFAANPSLGWRVRLWNASKETRSKVLQEVWSKAVEIDLKSDGDWLGPSRAVPQFVEDGVVSIGMEYLYSDDPPTSRMAIDILCKAGRKQKDVLPALIKFNACT